MMLGDCLWHVYALTGKLSPRIYVLSSPDTGPTASISVTGSTRNAGTRA